MSTILRFKRGTTAELASLTESLGEIAVDTSKKTLVVMDGSTTGGTPLATESYVANAISGLGSGSGTDSQTLSLSGNTLSITGGNSVNLSSLSSDLTAYSTTVQMNYAIDAAIASGGVTTLGALSDVNSTATAGQVLTADGAGNFTFTTVSGGGDLTNYYNKAEVDAAIAGVSAGAPDLTQATLGQLGNVDTATAVPTTGQALVFDGTNWVPGTVSGGGEVDLTPYFNKQTSSEQIVSGRTVLSAGLSVIPKGAIDTTEGFSTYPSARSYIRGALPGTRRFDADGNMIMDGDNPANFGSQLDIAFQRYGQNADGTIDMNNVEDIGWFGLANWNRNIVFSSSRDGEGGVSYMEFLRDTGRLRMRGTDTEIYIGVETDGAGGRVGDNAIVFANNVAGDKAILAGTRTYYAGRGDGLTNIPWTALVDVPAELGGSGVPTDFATASVGDLGDVDLSTAANSGQALVWNGTSWAPGDVSGSGSVDLTGYARLATQNTWTGENIFDNQRTVIRGTLEGKSKWVHGPKDGMNVINHMVLQSNPEMGLAFSPMFINDLGMGLYSGTVTDVIVTSTNDTVPQPSETQKNALFDAESSYWGITGSNFTSATDEVVVEIPLGQRLEWSAIIGVQFAGNGFSPRYCKIEAYHNSDDPNNPGTELGWQEVITQDYATDNTIGNRTNYVMSDISIASSGGVGVTAIRFTMRKDPAQFTNSVSDIRISGVFAVQANSPMGTSLFVDRKGGDIYGNLNIVGGNITKDGVALATTADVTTAIDAATIAAGGGATTLTQLTDVDTSSAGHVPTDGQALVWNESMGHWMPGTVAATGGVDQATVDSTVSTALADYSTTAEMNTAITTAVSGVSGGSGASLVKGTATVTNNGQEGTLVVTGYGSDLSGLTVTSSANGDIITVGGLNGTEIQSIKWLQMPGFNTQANVSFVFPDPDGSVTPLDMRFPSFDAYNLDGTLVTVIGHKTTTDNAGTTTVLKAGIAGGTGYQFSIRY